MSVFYAYSNNRDESRSTYDKVCEKLNNIIIDVDNNTNNDNNLLDKIKNHINEADIFVCDITPDYILNENISLPNPNVMLELGYALDKFNKNNIIIILNEKITKIIPSMIHGFEILYYNSESTEYEMYIVDKINEFINNIYNPNEKIGWKTIDYKLSDKFITSIQNLLDIRLIDYIFRYNKIYNQCVIIFPC